jgi:glycosyltransferase involved in cell wall biosynthesis
MKVCHMLYSDGGCSWHRHLQPARFCGDYFRERGWDIQVGEGLGSDPDVFFWHGLPMNDVTTTALLMAFQNKGKFVWSVDDDWLSVPDWNPAKPSPPSLAMYHVLKEMADYILVSTPHLASTFSDVKEKVLITPNLIDVTAFPPMDTREDEKGTYPVMQPPKGPVRIVWSGGPTHKEDIGVLTEALDQLLSKYGSERCVVVFNGMAPPPKLLTKYLARSLFHQPTVPFQVYQKTLNSIESHIYLAPMAAVPFNLSKSNLRVVEGWALRAPSVATDWGEYSCIRNGVDGRLVENDPEAWYSALVRLVLDHETRIQMALRGYARVVSEYNWKNPACRTPWIKAFSTIFEIDQ